MCVNLTLWLNRLKTSPTTKHLLHLDSKISSSRKKAPINLNIIALQITASLRSQLHGIMTRSRFSPQSLEELTERCESALALLGDALQSMDTEPLPDCIKVLWHIRHMRNSLLVTTLHFCHSASPERSPQC